MKKRASPTLSKDSTAKFPSDRISSHDSFSPFLCLYVHAHIPLSQDKSRGIKVDKEKADEKVERIFSTFQEAQEFLGVSNQTIWLFLREKIRDFEETLA